jgi:hypothetical protein
LVVGSADAAEDNGDGVELRKICERGHSVVNGRGWWRMSEWGDVDEMIDNKQDGAPGELIGSHCVRPFSSHAANAAGLDYINLRGLGVRAFCCFAHWTDLFLFWLIRSRRNLEKMPR